MPVQDYPYELDVSAVLRNTLPPLFFGGGEGGENFESVREVEGMVELLIRVYLTPFVGKLLTRDGLVNIEWSWCHDVGVAC